MIPANFISLAVCEAVKSIHRHRIGAVIFHKKTVISKGYNKPFRFSSKLHPKYTHYPNSLHAEVAAILAARQDLRGLEILVIRLGRGGDLRLSLPCQHCMMYIQDTGIKRVYYSDKNGDIKEVKI